MEVIVAEQVAQKVGDELSMIKAAQAGDKDALRELVEKYGKTVYGFSYRVCRNEEAAEDTLQEAFLSILKSLQSFDFKSSFSTWIYRVVSNSCLMKFRKEKRDRWTSFETMAATQENLPTDFNAWPDSPLDVVSANELKVAMDEAILNLPPTYRLAFVLKDLEGLKIEEVAASLEISIPAAKARIRRARLFLREELQHFMEHE